MLSGLGLVFYIGCAAGASAGAFASCIHFNSVDMQLLFMRCDNIAYWEQGLMPTNTLD